MSAKGRRTWRDEIRPLVAECIASGRVNGLEGRKLWLHVNRSCPWRSEGYHPYKIWRHEAAVQIGLKSIRLKRNPIPREPAPGQGELFT